VSQHHTSLQTRTPAGAIRRALRRGGLSLAAAGAVTAVAVLSAPAASAHVRVFPDTTEGGRYAKLTFRVPNESDTAGTTSLVVTLPEAAPLGSVSVLPIPGWTASVTNAKLAKPIVVHGTTLDEAPRTVTWTAAPGTQVAPGQFQEFSISAGPLPESGDMVFAAAQKYSDGTVVDWNEPAPADGSEAEHPAPEFAITPAAGDAHGATEDEAAGPAQGAAVLAATKAADDADGRASTALWLAAVSLVIGAGGVLVGAVGIRRGRQS
jgi:uncharacterized protein YcnI